MGGDDLGSPVSISNNPGPNADPRLGGLLPAADLMADHAPPDMRNQSTPAHVPGRRQLQLHAAFAEDRRVEDGVVLLDLAASSPPPAAHIDEIGVLGETAREPAHVVCVPSPFDLAKEHRNNSLIHGLHGS